MVDAKQANYGMYTTDTTVLCHIKSLFVGISVLMSLLLIVVVVVVMAMFFYSPITMQNPSTYLWNCTT